MTADNYGHEVIALRWFNGGIGFVAVLGEDTAKWFKVYVGTGFGFDEDADVKRIAAWGDPILDEPLARLLAPMCADREYRT